LTCSSGLDTVRDVLGRRKGDRATPTMAANQSAPAAASLPTYVEMSFAKVPMFSACTMDELLRVAERATVRDVASGTDVIVEASRGDEFFVILEGNVLVTRRGSAVAELGPGDFFGELALFDDAPRDATVTATSSLRVAVLGRNGFAAALEEKPIRDHVLTGMARRLHELDARS
jgi:CRP-like cAMP-binding protein